MFDFAAFIQGILELFTQLFAAFNVVGWLS